MSKFPGYSRIQGPETHYTLGTDGAGNVIRVQTAEDYKLWHRVIILSRNDKIWTPDLNQLIVRINHGRWVADCTACNTGMLTRPDWNLACCSVCGAIYEGTLKFPADSRIEALIRLRPDITTQHWDHLQTAEDLLRENQELQLA